jgi:hypothetical protein
LILAVLLSACASPTPTPQARPILTREVASPTPAGQIETQVAATVAAREAATTAVEQAVKLTLTASAPKATVPSTPTATLSPTVTPAPIILPTLLPASPTTAPTAANEQSNWVIAFIYNFPAGFWSEGTHQYTLVEVCPQQGLPLVTSGTYPGSFQVSKSAPLLPNPVYIRVGGLRDNMFAGGGIGAIHPSQPTIAVLRFINLTRSAVEIAKNCKSTISWDGGAPQSLTPQEPFQR